MNRRKFIKTAVSAGVSSVLLSGCLSNERKVLVQGNKPQNGNASDETSSLAGKMVIAEGTDPEVLMNKGLASMGGIEQFVKKGNLVAIKPNFSYTLGPEAAVTTNPLLVGALVRKCLQAGAREVRVVDHTFGSGEGFLEASGIQSAVSSAGGRAFNINSHDNYRMVSVNQAILKEVDYSKDVLDADAFINIPILKQCRHTEITAGFKNLMGIVWDRGVFHQTDLNQTIAEVATVRKPTLTILDAIRGITANGPSGPGPIKEWKQVIFGTDMLAVDAYGASLLNFNAVDVKHLVIAGKLGIGKLNWQSLNIERV